MKKFVAILLMIIIMLPVSPAIGLTAEQTEYESSISFVEALGIMNGYPDGTFRPGENVTRAEFASVISKILNLSPDVSDGEVTPYYDVPASHWASPYVNIANSYGLMNGYGNGYFMPEENITVNEATKVMVVLAGYEYFAIASGGYPLGYFVQANSLGLMEGINSGGDTFIKRGELAHMLCSVFEVDMYLPVSYGEDVNIRKEDGVTVLSKYHDIYETEGVVSANEFTSLGGDTDGFDDKVEIDGEKYHIGIDDASSYLGYNVKVYYREEKSGRRTVVYMLPYNNKLLTFPTDDLADVNGYRIGYYEKSGRERTIEIESNTDIILNNEFAGRAINFDMDSLSRINGTITLISNDGDNKYDVIFIKDYTVDMVEGVDVEGERIRFRFGTNGFSLEDASYIIYKNGEQIELSELMNSDVLIIAASKSFLDGGQNGVVEIIVSNKMVSGTVYGRGDDMVIISSNDGNNEYQLSSAFVSENGLLPAVGNSGVFYLDDNGRVICFQQSDGGMQFGYLIDARVSTGIDAGVQLKILTASGEIVVADVKDTLKMDGKSVTSEEMYNSLMNISGASDVSMIIRYMLNEDNILTAIDTASKNTDDDPNELTLKEESARMRFQDKSKMLTCATPQRYIIDDGVKVFEIPGEKGDDDEYSVYGSAYFQAFEYYGGSESGKTMTFCNVKDGVPAAIFMMGGSSSASTKLGGILMSENPTGVIKKKSYAFNADGTECIKLVVDSHNMDVELYITEETTFLFANGTQVVSDTLPGASSKLTVDDFNFGDVVMYDVGSKNKVKVLLRINDTDVSKLTEGEYQVTGMSGYTEFIMGSVRSKNGTVMELDVSTSPNLYINAMDKLYVHLIDMKSQKITKAVLDDIWASEADSEADKIFARIRFGSVKEIYIYR